MAQSTVPATAPFQQPQYVEDLGAYRKGGLHPVHIGDEIGGNYVIIDKLGHGDISTVWLATPAAQPDTYVALAVHMAEASEAAEARVVSRWSNLNKGDTDHPGKANILLPQDWFTMQGPNGAHFCLVTPVAGQSVSAATKRDLIEGSRPLPLPTAKRVALGLVRGLQYSHSMKLAHGDLHPGNLLLGLPEDVETSATALSNLRGPPPIFPISQQDDNRDASGSSRPSYLVEGIFAREMDPRMFSGAAKIGDWGDAFFDDDPPVRTAWCGPYMTPEFNSPGSITMAEDVWMLGCAIFQMLTGHDLFGKKNDPSSKVLQAMVRLLGPPPDHFVTDWRSYVEEMEGRPLSLSVEPPTTSLKQKVVESISQSYGPNVVSENDLMNLGSLLESILVWDPSQRLTIGEVADHAAMSFFLYS